MKRREFLALASAAAAFPRIALAQQPAKVPRVAWLNYEPGVPDYLAGFREGLTENGLVEGRDVALDFFIAPSTAELPEFAAKAVATSPSVILAGGGLSAPAAKEATHTIPVVFASVSDPIGIGLVTDIAHPEGNLTGTTLIGRDVVGKQLAILREAIPTLRRVALLNLPTSQPNVALTNLEIDAAKMLGIEPAVVDFVETDDFVPQFGGVVAAGVQAVFVPISGYFASYRDQLADLQLMTNLPLMWPNGMSQPRAMLGYGASSRDAYRKSASFVAAILKGAKPRDLPVELPTVFDSAVNLATAKAIGITIPPSILAQATIVTQ